jgi:hypothetical protein
MAAKKFNVLHLLMSMLIVVTCSDNKHDYYILNFDDYKLRPYYDNVFPDSYEPHHLTKKEIANSQQLLKEAIESYNKKSSTPLDLDQYGQQFIGALSPEGEIIVYANCFCNPEKFDYREKYLVVASDGGDCYFHLLINLSKNKIIEGMTHGSA